MIGDDDDERVIIKTFGLETIDQFADSPVSLSNGVVVSTTKSPPRIAQVHPEKEGWVASLGKPPGGPANYLVPMALDGLIAAFAALRLAKRGVVTIKPAVAALKRAILWI
jgi:hypothetical protein